MAALPKIVSSLEGEETKANDSSNATPATRNPIHWIISWDINETILVGDEVGGDTREDCFNKIIAKSAFVRMNSEGDEGATTVSYDYENTSTLTPTLWWDGTPIGATTNGPIPPLYTGWDWPEGCCPYYRTSYKKDAKNFVEHHGAMYKPLYQEIAGRLEHNHNPDSPFRNILPSFFRTIAQLVTEAKANGDPPITFVFRTFGTDLPQIAKAMTAFCQGQHPDYPEFIHPEYALDQSRLYYAKWVPIGQATNKEQLFQYQLYRQDDDHNTLVAKGDQQVLTVLQDTACGHYTHGIRDDYHMWKSHNWEPWAGKPVWKTPHTDHHHILLDDNIHNLKGDGIACVRTPRPMADNGMPPLIPTRQGGNASSDEEDEDEVVFETLEAAEKWHGIHLIRVPTIEPVLKEDWFLEQIHKAQAAALEDWNNIAVKDARLI